MYYSMYSKPKRSKAKPVAITAVILLLAFVGYSKFHITSPSGPGDTISNTSEQAIMLSHPDAGLQHIIGTWARQHSFNSEVIVQELNGQKRTAGRNPDTLMTTASTYKIFVAYATLHQVERGKITMSSRTRTGQTVGQALNKMIVRSDNSSGEALGFLVGWNTVDWLAANVGASHTHINNYGSTGKATNGNKQSTAADLTTMVARLQQGTLLNSSNTSLLLGLMKSQIWRERIPAGIPSGTSVADKPGWLSNVENDAAIVYGPKSTYTLVIMTNGSTTQPLADLSRLIYNYLES
jgi:beta-lactamase class A